MGGQTVGDRAAELDAAIVLNIAGELVDRRPTPRNVELLRRSCVDPRRALVRAAARLGRPALLRDHDDLEGVVHLTPPNPVQNRDVIRTLRVAARGQLDPVGSGAS